MSQQLFKQVEPIRPGYLTYIRLQYTPEFWDAIELGTGRLVAQFRTAVASPIVLFEADSAEATISREDGNVLLIAIPAAASVAWTDAVMFDIINIVGSVKTPIPGIWRWPVSARVTRDVV
ncbi:hypothetical protein [Mesorhizobium sp. STM 4661]|uniref:hypothetical protein n=1 Tax=Mesorhizobium sp. STM 4661 TaxID=1297570 RepID=UPI0002BFE047|nr:hypothetical protein [Mesorhizobium sp. STM 4661]CCV12946.1 hypothetical protein MESS4_510113 [Mesorhizobium sp. STM 4661]